MAAPEQAIQYSSKPGLDELALKSKQMDLQSGLLGKLFGADKNAPMNIAGTIGVALTAAGIAAMFFKTATEVTEIWKFIAPIISGILGFIFGKKQ